MPHQYLNHVINQSTKRRMHDDNEEEDQVIPMTRPIQGSKRQNDLSQEFNPNNGPPKAEIPLPSLTFASPDYRPPPRADALWLQPVPPTQPPPTMPSSQPMMEEDSTDEDDILPANTNAYLDPKQPNGIDWIMADQC